MGRGVFKTFVQHLSGVMESVHKYVIG